MEEENLYKKSYTLIKAILCFFRGGKCNYTEELVRWVKKFKFRFQTILDLRTRELEQAEQKLAEAQRDLFNAKETLKKLFEAVKQNQTALEQTLSANGHIDLVRVNSFQNYLKSLDFKIANQHTVIQNAEENLEIVRQEMLQVRQKKLMMDKLKETDYKKYLKEFELNDMRMIDEIASSRYKRDQG